MKRIKLNPKGKKYYAWQRARTILVRDALVDGRISLKNGLPYGVCADCGKFSYLDPDHKQKRSQCGSNEKENIEWVCERCHDMRDNKGDPNKKKITKERPEWAKEHRCSCGTVSSILICPECGKLYPVTESKKK